MEREIQGLSRPQLSERSGIPYSTVAEIENERQHSSTQIHDLCRAFPRKLRPDYLADGKLPKYAEDADKGGPASTAWPFDDVTPQEWGDLNDTFLTSIAKLVRDAVNTKTKKVSAPGGRRHSRGKSSIGHG